MTIDSAINDFFETDKPIIDLTEPKTFAAAVVIAVLCGFMIGFGYYMVFTSMDCTNPLMGKSICFPNEYANHKLQIMIITMIAGILTGLSPAIIRYVRQMQRGDQR